MYGRALGRGLLADEEKKSRREAPGEGRHRGSGGLEVWRSGGLEVWRSGGLEVWRSGVLEIWSSACQDVVDQVVEADTQEINTMYGILDQDCSRTYLVSQLLCTQ